MKIIFMELLDFSVGFRYNQLEFKIRKCEMEKDSTGCRVLNHKYIGGSNMNPKHLIFSSIIPLKLKFADILLADPTGNNPQIMELAEKIIFPTFPEASDAGFAFLVVLPQFIPKSAVDTQVIHVSEKYSFINDVNKIIDKQIVDEERKLNLPYHQEKVREVCQQMGATAASSTITATDNKLYLIQANLITL